MATPNEVMALTTHNTSFEDMMAHLATLPRGGSAWWAYCRQEAARNPKAGTEPFEPDEKEAMRIMNEHMQWVRDYEGEKER